MKLDKINLEGKKQQIEVQDKLFSEKINKKSISGVIYKLNSNYKGRKSKTKQRNEIKGSTSKIYEQKVTGNARHASRKAPIFVGGGVAHGPKGETKYKKLKINKTEKRMSVRLLISEKNSLKNLIIMDDFISEIKKTKEMAKVIKVIDASNSLFLIDENSKNKIYKSSKNIPNIKVTDVNHFSSFDLIKYKKLVLTESSVKELEKKYL